MIDLGGNPWFWRESGIPCKVLVVNIDITVSENKESYEPQIKVVKGDATQLSYENASFDIVYSNSLIEHLGTWETQQKFANEARRLGKQLWIQTPSRWFPIEPHFITPFIHYLPKWVQKHLVCWFTLWGWESKPTTQQTVKFLAEIRLLTYREMQTLFPDCKIIRERILGLTKSYIAVRC